MKKTNWIGLVDHYIEEEVKKQQAILEDNNSSKYAKTKAKTILGQCSMLISKSNNVKNIYETLYLTEYPQDIKKYTQHGAIGSLRVYSKNT